MCPFFTNTYMGSLKDCTSYFVALALKKKTQTMNQEANKSNSHASGDPSNPCPICLGPILQDSYLDKCFRTFLLYLCLCVWLPRKLLKGKRKHFGVLGLFAFPFMLVSKLWKFYKDWKFGFPWQSNGASIFFVISVIS